MFTGIIEGLGIIQNIQRHPQEITLQIRADFPLRKTKIGDSIAVNGCCLTVTKLKEKDFWVDLSPETLEITSLKKLAKGSRVNLERALRLGDRLDGHLVQGHVDGVGKILKIENAKTQQNFFFYKIQSPKKLLPYLVSKGSIAVDGVSLTINKIEKNSFELCLIPHTLEKTNWQDRGVGDLVNLEADLIVKYLHRQSQKVKKRA